MIIQVNIWIIEISASAWCSEGWIHGKLFHWEYRLDVCTDVGSSPCPCPSEGMCISGREEYRLVFRQGRDWEDGFPKGVFFFRVRRTLPISS